MPTSPRFTQVTSDRKGRPYTGTRSAVRDRAARWGHPALQKRNRECVGEGLCPSRKRGNRRSASGPYGRIIGGAVGGPM